MSASEQQRRPVVCITCGGRWDVGEDQTSSEVGVKHLGRCPNRDPWRCIPAWSIGFPWIHAPAEDQVFTHEVGWKAEGNVTANVPLIVHGGMAKLWHPYPFEVQAKIIRRARKKARA